MYQGQGQRFVSVVREKVASPNNVIEDWPLVSLFGAKAHVKRKKKYHAGQFRSSSYKTNFSKAICSHHFWIGKKDRACHVCTQEGVVGTRLPSESWSTYTFLYHFLSKPDVRVNRVSHSCFLQKPYMHINHSSVLLTVDLLCCRIVGFTFGELQMTPQ